MFYLLCSYYVRLLVLLGSYIIFININNNHYLLNLFHFLVLLVDPVYVIHSYFLMYNYYILGHKYGGVVSLGILEMITPTKEVGNRDYYFAMVSFGVLVLGTVCKYPGEYYCRSHLGDAN